MSGGLICIILLTCLGHYLPVLTQEQNMEILKSGDAERRNNIKVNTSQRYTSDMMAQWGNDTDVQNLSDISRTRNTADIDYQYSTNRDRGQSNYTQETPTKKNNNYSMLTMTPNLTTDAMAEGYINPLLVSSRLVYKYGMTMIFIFGVVGNFLVILTIIPGRTGQSSSSLYLIALAVLDQYNIFAAVLGSHMIRSYTGFDYIRSHPWACKFAYFSIVTCAQSSFWLVAIMSLERAIVLNYPFKFKDKFNRFTTRTIIIIVVLFWALKNLHLFWSQGSVYKQDENGTMIKVSHCGIVAGPTYHFNIRIRPWIDYVATFGAAIIILICNFAIIIALFRSNKLQQTSVSGIKGTKGIHRNMIAMLLTVSIAFLFLALPLQIITILVPRNPNDVRSNEAATADLLWSIGLLTSYANNAVNFYLYCLSGTIFRRDLARLFRCGFKDVPVARSGICNGTKTTVFATDSSVYIAKISESTRL